MPNVPVKFGPISSIRGRKKGGPPKKIGSAHQPLNFANGLSTVLALTTPHTGGSCNVGDVIFELGRTVSEMQSRKNTRSPTIKAAKRVRHETEATANFCFQRDVSAVLTPQNRQR